MISLAKVLNLLSVVMDMIKIKLEVKSSMISYLTLFLHKIEKNEKVDVSLHFYLILH